LSIHACREGAAGQFGSLGTGVLDFLKSFRRRRAPARVTGASPELWQIDLRPVDEPMVDGRVERISLKSNEPMSLGRAAKKRAVEQDIAKPAERNFDWQSVQLPEPHPQDLADNGEAHNGHTVWAEEEPFDTPDDRPLDRVFDRAPPPAEDRPLDRVFERRPQPGRLTPVEGAKGTLTVHGVEKSFAKRKVVKGVSLAVRRGEAVGLLGPNGAGKTTVFYMITGLIPADRGQIRFEGHDITHLPMYQRARLGIGYLPQEASIFRGLNVEDNIRAVLEVVERDKKKREFELDKLLDEFNITRLRKTPSIALSGGERRRTEIARALASRPSYMLLDEPFAGIDPIAVGDIQDLVRHLKERGIGVLITDHNVRETLGLTDRAYIIYSGEVLREGNAEDIINDPEVRRLYLGQEFRM
jgi:lipopolysaccharide export system ATP-binding protein